MKEKIHLLFDRYAGIILSLPAFILLFLFVVWPFFLAFFSSFTNMSVKTIINPSLQEFIGADHYISLLGSPDFLSALKNTAYFTLLAVPLQVLLALLFALAVKGSHLWQRMMRISFFLPVVTSMAVLSVVWSLLFNPSMGFFNYVLSSIGFASQKFLDRKTQAMNCIILMSVWQGAGFQMMIILAGLQTIPVQLYEAARIENAGPFQRFRYITFPLLRNTLIFVLFITTIFSFKLFVQPYLLTNGGPEGATRTLIMYLYEEAFVNSRYGKASAVSVIFFLIVFGITLLQRKLLPGEYKA